GHLVEDGVVGRYDVGVRADPEPGGVDAARLEPVELGDEHAQVDDDPVGADGGDTGRQDAAGEPVPGVLLAPDDHRVPRVVAAVELHYVVDLRPQEVGRLALALVAPLGAHQDDRWHVPASPSSVSEASSYRRAGGRRSPRLPRLPRPPRRPYPTSPRR